MLRPALTSMVNDRKWIRSMAAHLLCRCASEHDGARIAAAACAPRSLLQMRISRCAADRFVSNAVVFYRLLKVAESATVSITPGSESRSECRPATTPAAIRTRGDTGPALRRPPA